MNKLIEKIKRKIILLKYKIGANILSIFAWNKLNWEQVQIKEDWKTYLYLKNKYKNKISKMKTLESSGEFSNKVWWCWLQGEENAPELNKACLQSLRQNLKDREIIIITSENINNYITLPDYIMNKYKKGIISHTHFSDIVRLELLINHGGTWIDSSVLCTSYNTNLFDRPLLVYQNWRRGNVASVLSNWFITSEKENPILIMTRDLLFDYWKNNDYLINYFIFHIFFTLATEKYEKLWKQMPRYSNVPPHILKNEIFNEYTEERFEEIKAMSSFHKLTQKVDFSKFDNNSFYHYIIKKYGKEKGSEI